MLPVTQCLEEFRSLSPKVQMTPWFNIIRKREQIKKRANLRLMEE